MGIRRDLRRLKESSSLRRPCRVGDVLLVRIFENEINFKVDSAGFGSLQQVLMELQQEAAEAKENIEKLKALLNQHVKALKDAIQERDGTRAELDVMRGELLDTLREQRQYSARGKAAAANKGKRPQTSPTFRLISSTARDVALKDGDDGCSSSNAGTGMTTSLFCILCSFLLVKGACIHGESTKMHLQRAESRGKELPVDTN